MKKFLKKIVASMLCAATGLLGCAALSACGGGGNRGGSGHSYTAELQYGKWSEYEGVKIAFMDEQTYNYGDIDESNVLPELDCTLNERYYMVMDFDIQAPYDNDGTESVIAAVQISPASAVAAKIQQTQSGNTSEETADGITTLTASYLIPESVEEIKQIRFAVQIIASARTVATIDLTFESDGGMQAVKTGSVKKRATASYTDSLTFELVEDDYYYVRGNGGDKNATSVIIPNIHEGYPVTAIGQNAFYGCGKLTDIFMPDGVLFIDTGAFNGCSALTDLELPRSLESIGEDAFASCGNLTDVTFHDNLKNIVAYAFQNCSSLKNIVLPEGLIYIGTGAFKSCGSLTGITIPSSLTDIFERAFEWCSSLTEINFTGTKAQWQSLKKSTDWDKFTGDYVVKCTDGEL